MLIFSCFVSSIYVYLKQRITKIICTYIWRKSVWTEIWRSQWFERSIIGNIICAYLTPKYHFSLTHFVHTLQEILLLIKRREPLKYNEVRSIIFRSQSQKILYFYLFRANQIVSKCFSKIRFVAWGIYLLQVLKSWRQVYRKRNHQHVWT